MKRQGTSIWHGSGKDGSGRLTTQSKALKDAHYSAKSRFEDAAGTNPEELVAAAHAGCYNMKLAFVLAAAGHTAEKLDTHCTITLEDGTITNSHLVVRASVPDISEDVFQASVEDARQNCPISRLLDTEITVDAALA